MTIAQTRAARRRMKFSKAGRRADAALTKKRAEVKRANARATKKA